MVLSLQLGCKHCKSQSTGLVIGKCCCRSLLFLNKTFESPFAYFLWQISEHDLCHNQLPFSTVRPVGVFTCDSKQIMSFFLGYNFRLNKHKHAPMHQFISFMVQDVNKWLAALKHEQKWRYTTGKICYKVEIHEQLDRICQCSFQPCMSSFSWWNCMLGQFSDEILMQSSVLVKYPSADRLHAQPPTGVQLINIIRFFFTVTLIHPYWWP